MEYELLEALLWWLGAIALGLLGYILELQRELRASAREADELRSLLRERQ